MFKQDLRLAGNNVLLDDMLCCDGEQTFIPRHFTPCRFSLSFRVSVRVTVRDIIMVGVRW